MRYDIIGVAAEGGGHVSRDCYRKRGRVMGLSKSERMERRKPTDWFRLHR